MATNTLSGRFQRRHQRLQRPDRSDRSDQDLMPILMDAGPALPDLLPARQRPLPQRKQVPGRRSVASLLYSVVMAVNARGLCAAHAARVAELPADEVQGIEGMCRCQGCLLARAQ